MAPDAWRRSGRRKTTSASVMRSEPFCGHGDLGTRGRRASSRTLFKRTQGHQNQAPKQSDKTKRAGCSQHPARITRQGDSPALTIVLYHELGLRWPYFIFSHALTGSSEARTEFKCRTNAIKGFQYPVAITGSSVACAGLLLYAEWKFISTEETLEPRWTPKRAPSSEVELQSFVSLGTCAPRDGPP